MATDLDAQIGEIDRGRIQVAFAPPSQELARAMRAGGKVQFSTVRDVVPGSVLLIPASYEQALGPMLIVVPPEGLSTVAADPSAAASAEIDRQLGRRASRGLGMSAYLESAAALIDGVKITRRDVIRFVANKLGGAHYDTRRGGRPVEQRFVLLDKVSANYLPSIGPEANGAYVELLSIAEALQQSTDAARFVAAFERAERQAKAQDS
jgi:hypothetical protein